MQKLMVYGVWIICISQYVTAVATALSEFKRYEADHLIFILPFWPVMDPKVIMDEYCILAQALYFFVNISAVFVMNYPWDTHSVTDMVCEMYVESVFSTVIKVNNNERQVFVLSDGGDKGGVLWGP